MRLYSFGPKFIAVAAAALLVAACETAPESTAATGGSGGATAAAPAPSQRQLSLQEDLVVNVGDRVFFATNKSDLSPQARATLDRQSAWMKKNAQVRLVVEGHADERGTREYNLALGERRANAARNYLVNQGIAANRLQTISYGKERPVALGHNEAAWAQNRRAVSVVAN
jgi:peptidoglycan-associated lipoprotein